MTSFRMWFQGGWPVSLRGTCVSLFALSRLLEIVKDTIFSDANIEKNHDIFTLLPENYAFFAG